MSFRVLKSLFFAVGMASICSGCTSGANRKADGPQGTLKEYISESFHLKGVADRDRILSFLTGQARARLSAWSDEQFIQAFVTTPREFVKLVILEDKLAERKDAPSEENITYELTYVDHGRAQGGKGALVTNKKLCRLVNEQGKWLIAEMRNIKELVEYRNEMTFPF